MSKKNSVAKQTQSSPKIPVETTSTLEMYSGPIPAPSTLEHYESIMPGSSQIIFAMAQEEQALQRLRLEKEHDLQEHSLTNESEELSLFARGQIWAGSITIASMGVIVLGALTNNPLLIGSGLITGIAPIVKLFLPRLGKNTDDKK
jgi:uncharacterized membrane protein